MRDFANDRCYLMLICADVLDVSDTGSISIASLKAIVSAVNRSAR